MKTHVYAYYQFLYNRATDHFCWLAVKEEYGGPKGDTKLERDKVWKRIEELKGLCERELVTT